ncbi:MAG: FKBP-type peptidyl-prolyl cis-trans isomerase [Halobacteriales archaeon]
MSENDEADPAESVDPDEPEQDADIQEDASAESETVEENAAEVDAADDETGDGAGDGDSEEGLEDGDFVRLDYTIWTVEDDSLVDTTDEELAEEEGIDTEGRDFAPQTVVLGGGHLFPGVEDDIVGREVGGSGSVEIPAGEAFGEFDPEQVRTISADRLPEDNRQPGAQVTIDGEQGFVETVIGGRARVDFNHPLAGDDIEYEYEILGVVEDRLERAQELLATYLDMQLDVFIDTEEDEETVYDEDAEEETTEIEEYETLYIEATPQLTMNQQWMFSKSQIADDLRERIGVDRVVVREVLDGGGMMGGMGGMMGGMGGDVDEEELESAIEEADLDEEVDADEVVEELDVGGEEGEEASATEE